MAIIKETPTRWSDLTEEQQQKYGNGCGPQWLPESIAGFLFGWLFDASCRRHDFAYDRGGLESDRLKADNGFFKAMLSDATRLTGSKLLVAILLTGLFYLLVRIFGWMAFNYGPYK